MTHRERVIKAITFDRPDVVPLWMLNKNQKEGDVLWYDIRQQSGTQVASYHGGEISEWGFTWKRLDDGTMGQPSAPVIADWDDLNRYRFPELKPDERLRRMPEFLEESEGYFRLAMPIITGFEVYRALRGFENTMVDLAEASAGCTYLLDRIFDFEEKLMTLAAEAGLDAFYFGDDWGTQQSLMISPEMWKRHFRERYRHQFDHAHNLGLYTIFHSCGNVTSIVPELHDIGLDVMYISQPGVVDLQGIGKELRGKQCFMSLIDYQEVSISRTTQEIMNEGRRIRDLLEGPTGGFIGYVEDYSCMGMSNENFEACGRSFRA